MNKIKNRYKGIFNYQHQVHILYTFAYSEKQAKVLLIKHLSKIVDRDFMSLWGLYLGQIDNYAVMLETEFKECEEIKNELDEGFKNVCFLED